MKLKSITLVETFALIMMGLVAQAHADTYAPWLTQIGINDSIMSAANWGRGQILGVVDTGVNPNSPVFKVGQVSNALSSCAAVSFKCTNGYMDDNSHGTSVASIAAANGRSPFSAAFGGYKITQGAVIGVAPNANIVAEKVLAASGSGYSTDVANGVRKAADAGAGVINVSITYGNSSDVVSAINYAASKGAFIVWAGGNSSQDLLGGANTNGLTPDAVKRLVFAGSVGATNALSSFSNKPGQGGLVAGTTKTSYSSRWVMAPGEAILAPYNSAGSTAWSAWSGTSMAAPVVSGSLMLLQDAWPILKTNGTTANLLLATTTDLGTRGVDAIYGNGLVNLSKAFQPYGSLSITQANGKSIGVTNLTGSMISSGALGSISAVQTKLANYNAFDTYQRNFGVNLASLIKTPSATATINPLPTNNNSGPIAMRLADGSEMVYMQSMKMNDADRLGLQEQQEAVLLDQQNSIYAAFTDKAGNVTAMGYGFPVQYSYARAMYGSDDMARLSSELGTSNLSGLARGGAFFSFGAILNDDDRIAFSYNSSSALGYITPGVMRTASNFGFGYTHQFSDDLVVGVNYGLLNEQSGLLGASYGQNSAVGFGNSNSTNTMGLSMGYLIDKNNSFLLEAGFANTSGSSANGLFAGTTDIQSRSYGATFMTKNLMVMEDRLTLSVKQPLRVESGSVMMVTPTVDVTTGVAKFNREMVGLRPDAREIDLTASYFTPIGKTQSLSLNVGYMKDAYNISGNHNAIISGSWMLNF